MTDAGVIGIRGDLTRPETLRGACDGVATTLHLAANVGIDEDECGAVNTDGTYALLTEAGRSGARRVVYVSTTSVYGDGVHQGASETLLAPSPCSAASRSRLAAERAVRAVGGIVLRPHLTYGPGDKWFIPTLLRVLAGVPAWVDGGEALMSVVSVDDLAKVPAALATVPWGPRPGAVFHVSNPRPVSVRALIKTVCGQLGLPVPEHDLPAAEHRALTRRALPELTDHQYSLLAKDHWYESARIWRHAGVSPTGRLKAAVRWYGTQAAA